MIHAKLAVNESQFEMMEMMKEGKKFDDLKINEEFKTLVLSKISYKLIFFINFLYFKGHYYGNFLS